MGTILSVLFATKPAPSTLFSAGRASTHLRHQRGSHQGCHLASFLCEREGLMEDFGVKKVSATKGV